MTESVAGADRLATLIPPLPESAELTVTCAPDDFLASAIARAVEDADAHLINLNVTSHRHPDGSLLVHLRVNRRSCASVARSLERRGFTVVDGGFDPADRDFDSVASDRAANILRILDL
ncbi:MAG: hypothetical protein K2M97_07690 [Muribaculaceae bacterium]|nr:hypothetical protein [Muribaculaceae bacterium]